MTFLVIRLPRREANKLGKARSWRQGKRPPILDDARVLETLEHALKSPRELHLSIPQLKALIEFMRRNEGLIRENAPSVSRAIAELESVFQPNA